MTFAFEILDKGVEPSPMHKYLECNMIYTVKMDFTRKARFVGRGDKTPEPTNSTYAGVVSRESVRIALTYAALNDLEVMAADIRNAYLQAPSSELYYTICGPEFGQEYIGRKALIVRALYGTKTAGADFRNHLRSCMVHLGYESCLADPDVWMRAAKADDRREYYEYLLLYVDDTLAISEYPEKAIREVGRHFKMKESSIGPPKIYLGGKMSKVQLPNGVIAHAFSASQYIQEAVKNLEEQLQRHNRQLARKVVSPMLESYRPELDASPDIDSREASYYQSLIGILRWMVELGRIDIAVEVSMLSSQLALPRDGHLEALYRIFAYLKCHHNSRIVFDPTYPEINESDFKEQDWSTFYGNIKEVRPENAPVPRGKGFIMTGYVDADHAGEKLTRRSRTGYIIFLNMAPIYWFTKRQTGIETSSFGSEFIAMKQCTEYIRGLRYKLRMMGIAVEGATLVYGDNMSVLYNTSIPESTLKKKSNSIAYHFVREGAARKEWKTGYVNTNDNPSDILTKSVSNQLKRRKLVGMLMYDIYED